MIVHGWVGFYFIFCSFGDLFAILGNSKNYNYKFEQSFLNEAFYKKIDNTNLTEFFTKNFRYKFNETFYNKFDDTNLTKLFTKNFMTQI